MGKEIYSHSRLSSFEDCPKKFEFRYVLKVPSDHRFRISMDALGRMVEEDRAAGLTPIAVCANAGTTNTGAPRSPRGWTCHCSPARPKPWPKR